MSNSTNLVSIDFIHVRLGVRKLSAIRKSGVSAIQRLLI